MILGILDIHLQKNLPLVSFLPMWESIWGNQFKCTKDWFSFNVSEYNFLASFFSGPVAKAEMSLPRQCRRTGLLGSGYLFFFFFGDSPYITAPFMPSSVRLWGGPCNYILVNLLFFYWLSCYFSLHVPFRVYWQMTLDPLDWELKIIVIYVRALELNTGPIEEQPVLLTTMPSF